MKVTQTYTYLGEFVHEQVTTVDGEEISIVTNVLPSTGTPVLPPANTGSASSEEFAGVPVAEPLGEVVSREQIALECQVEAPSKKSVGKNVAAFIRGTWTFLIALFVESGGYLLENLTSLNIPHGYATFVGAALQGAIYATKKRVFPDTTL